jgi:hypothetical protein
VNRGYSAAEGSPPPLRNINKLTFLFTTASRTALGPTQPPIQWVPGAISLEGVKQPRREADHSPPSSAEVKECVELYLHFSNTPSWHGASLSTGTTLPLRKLT